MTVQTSTLRYQLPKKAIKSDCPDCAPRHRRTLSRYVDTRTGEPLPELYGRCDREANCGYHLSPYHKAGSGFSYADEVYQQWRDEQQQPRILNTTQRSKPTNILPATVPVYSLPNEVFTRSLAHYERNAFAHLLTNHFGSGVAAELLERFRIGTSGHWPGACVFWLVDERMRVRGGQVVLFDESGHTAKRSLPDGTVKRCTSWVHTALANRYKQKQQPCPEWLTTYMDKAEKFPIPFGLHQLSIADSSRAVAIVESPKMAIVCSAYFPQFIWMAVGGKSYINVERLRHLKGRKLVAFPDANAYYDLLNAKGQPIKGWLSKVEELQADGFSITISDYLEQRATDEEKAKGLDLADYLLNKWKGYPPGWDKYLLTEAQPQAS